MNQTGFTSVVPIRALSMIITLEYQYTHRFLVLETKHFHLGGGSQKKEFLPCLLTCPLHVVLLVFDASLEVVP